MLLVVYRSRVIVGKLILRFTSSSADRYDGNIIMICIAARPRGAGTVVAKAFNFRRSTVLLMVIIRFDRGYRCRGRISAVET